MNHLSKDTLALCEADQADAAPAGSGWPVWTSEMISNILAPVQKDLLDERPLLHILAQWCEPPSDRKAAVALYCL